MAQKSDREREEFYTNVFREVDQNGNGDGVVSPGELLKFLKEKCHQKIKKEQFQEIFCDLDKNKDGRITLEEFVPEMMLTERRQGFREAFQAADTDGSNTLTFDEITCLLQRIGKSPEEIEQLMKGFEELDLNKDGIISYDEFMSLV